MRDASTITIDQDHAIRRAIEILDRGQLGIVLVRDDAHRLAGILTDVDVRKALLRGTSLDAPVGAAMCKTPVVIRAGASASAVLDTMRARGVRQLPVLDADGRIAGVELLYDHERVTPRSAPVVIQAGGQGSRMRPLTDALPKPMLPVGGTPIIEILVQQLARQGFREIYPIVNYLPHVIEDHLGDGSRWGVRVTCLREPRPLGTAGGLALLRGRIAEPFLVVNGDLVTGIDFGELLAAHAESGAFATIGIREHALEVPYGVVRLDGLEVQFVEEKPTIKSYINAGIYAMRPEALDRIPDGPIAMTTLINGFASEGLRTRCFLIHEPWIDVGDPAEYARANEALAARGSGP